MWIFFRNQWTLFLQRRKQAQELTPAAFEALVCEILELADMTEKIHARETTVSVKITLLHQELIQLQNLLQKKEFRRLSQDKRIELKKNLIFSKNQLLEAMGSVPPPTNILQ